MQSYGEIRKNELGKTGEKISCMGLGTMCIDRNKEGEDFIYDLFY